MGVDGPAASPQAFLRLGSTSEAPADDVFATRFVCVKEFDDTALARIHGPAGLDLGGVTVAETALSILAEIVAARRGGQGGPLLARVGAIHR